MERRIFLAMIPVGLLATPLTVAAQRADSVPRIGYLGFSPSREGLESFRQALRELGRVDGQNITIEYRSTGEKGERAPELLAELIQLKVDLIYTPGSIAAAQAAQRATTTIPIVFYTPADPVKAGLVTSLARPGGNITGLTGGGESSKRFSLLKEAVPQAARVAILWNPNNPVHKPLLKDLEDAARSLKLQPQPIRVSHAGELEGTFSAIKRGQAGALYVMADAMFFEARKRIVALSAQARLPTIYFWRAAVEAGGLMSYQEDWSDATRRMATYVDRILNGTKPADLPVQQLNKFELVINLKTAKALGLTIPRSLLLQADQVIE
jgi:ABC-type uncharacterized transport system substrate-binding protein